MRRLKQYLFGKPELIRYRISQVLTLKRPYPLVKLLLEYSGNDIEARSAPTDPFYHWRATIHHEIRTQLQNLALLESYYRHHEEIPVFTPEGIRNPIFKLDVKLSQIRGAGKGLFISSGNIKQGQVVCCYPGLSYFWVSQGYIDQYGLNLRWPRGARDYILTLEGQIWIDANPRLSVVSHSKQNHLWAKGQYINHPSQGFTPNVVPVVFDYGPDFVSEASTQFRDHLAKKKINLEKFVPNEFAWEFARNQSEWIPGGVMVALRDIVEGEEIFYDYEWETNINYIEYSQTGDILIDWPWYQTVPQTDVDKLIEPWLSYRDFIDETKKDWRIIKTESLFISNDKQTKRIETKLNQKLSDDKKLLLNSNNNINTNDGNNYLGVKQKLLDINHNLMSKFRTKKSNDVNDNDNDDKKQNENTMDDRDVVKPKKKYKKVIKKTQNDDVKLDDDEPTKLTKKKVKSNKL